MSTILNKLIVLKFEKTYKETTGEFDLKLAAIKIKAPVLRINYK